MQRYQMKALLAEQEKLHPKLFASLLTAMKPLMSLQGADGADGADGAAQAHPALGTLLDGAGPV